MRSAETSVLALLAVAHALLACGALADESAAGIPSPGVQVAQPSTGQPPLPELLARAKALSASGRSQEAYELLAGSEDTYIGTIEFDYALGRAALDAGRPDRATLAFSRVLALDPNHAGAMIDTGRAFLALGNFAQARAAFEALLASDPPPPIRAQLLAYLEQAQRGRAAAGGGLSLRGYVAATLGHSSNVNQSPGQAQVFVPAFGASFELAQQNVRKADGYSSLAGGLDLSLPLDRTWSLIGGVDLQERSNFHENDFDLGGAGARVGFSASGETDLLRVQYMAGRSYLGNNVARDTNALSVEALKSLRPETQVLAFVQAGTFRHPPETLRIFDADFSTVGVGGSQQIAANSTVFVGISTGEEHDRGGNPNGDKRYVTLRLIAEAGIRPRMKLTASVAPQQAHYSRFDPIFLAERRDRRSDYEGALQYALDERLFLRTGVTQTVQRSNIPIYEFTRTEYWVMLRRDFW